MGEDVAKTVFTRQDRHRYRAKVRRCLDVFARMRTEAKFDFERPLRVLAAQERPVWSQMSFAAATDNFDSGARRGIDATLYWPGLGEVPATELVLRRLLPLAHEGLAAWGVDTAIAGRLLGVIEQRCISHTNGAEWQVRTSHRIDEQPQPLDRRDSLREMQRRYVEHMHTNEPVHTWDAQ